MCNNQFYFSKSKLVLVDNGWRLPVKYSTSKTVMRVLRENIRQTSTELDTLSKKIGIETQESVNTSHWNRMSGEISFRKQKKINDSSVQIAQELKKLMNPQRKINFNKKPTHVGKVLVDTWEVCLTMTKEGITATSKQDHIENKRIANLVSML